jgi:lipoprotein signal peptidase
MGKSWFGWKNIGWFCLWLAIAVGEWGIDWRWKSQLVTQLNPGASFSFFSQQFWLVVAGSVVVLLLVLIVPVMIQRRHPQLWKGRSILWWGSQALVVGGALSNLADRLVYGGVRDYWLIPGTPIRNNLADWGIVVGLMVMVGMWWLMGRQKE